MAIDERHIVDAEGFFQWRLFEELLQQSLRVKAVLDLDDEPSALLAVGEVFDIGVAQAATMGRS